MKRNYECKRTVFLILIMIIYGFSNDGVGKMVMMICGDMMVLVVVMMMMMMTVNVIKAIRF